MEDTIVNTASNITDVIGDTIDPKTQGDIMMRGLKFLGNTVISMIWYAGCFATFMIGTVYFKQEGMLFHPAPNEQYRKPEDMPPGYKSPAEYGF